MSGPASSTVSAGNTALAADYNNLRTDALLPWLLLTNKSGGTVNEGDVVVFDKANASSFTTTTVAADGRVCGVVISSSIASDAQGYVAQVGIVTVKVQGNVAIGQALITSTTVKRAAANGGARQRGFIGFATTSYSGGGAGTVSAILYPDAFRYGAAVLTGATAVINTTSGSTHSVTLDCGTASNRIVVLLGNFNNMNTGPTVGGQGCTEVGTGVNTPASRTIRMFYTVNPPTGNQTVTFTTNTSQACLVGCFVISGVYTTTPFGTKATASGTSTTPSSTITDGVAGDYVIGCFMLDTNTNVISSYGSGQTEILQASNSSGYRLAITWKEATGSSETSSATLTTSQGWAASSVKATPA